MRRRIERIAAGLLSLMILLTGMPAAAVAEEVLAEEFVQEATVVAETELAVEQTAEPELQEDGAAETDAAYTAGDSEGESVQAAEAEETEPAVKDADEAANDFRYAIKNGACAIQGYKGSDADVSIPAAIEGAPVTAIAKRAFSGNKKIVSVIIPDGVIEIGAEAFKDCTKLLEITVPGSVIELGKNAFKNCKKLTFTVDENSWMHNYCRRNQLAFQLSGRVMDAPKEILLDAQEYVLGAGQQMQLAVADDMGNTTGFTFKSSKSSIAKVDEGGVVKAVKAGTAKITVQTANGVTAECKIVVKAAPKSISLSEKSLRLSVGQSHQLTYTTSKNSIGEVRFESDSDCVAVDENGLLTANAAGSAKITAITHNGKKASCAVTVVDVPSFVRLKDSAISLPMGAKAQIVPVIDEFSATTYTYESADETIAAVDADGWVTGLKPGNTEITVTTHNGLTAVCEVTVTVAPTQITLNCEQLTLGVGEQFALTAADDLGNTSGFAFKSSKSSVAKVSADGVVKAAKAGTAVITVAAANGVTSECKVTVKRAPSSVKFAGKKLSLFVGQQQELKYSLSSKSAGKVSFSSDSDCVYVNEQGKVSALKEGEAKITVTTYNGKKATCIVEVRSSAYAVHALKAEGRQIIATVSADDACRLRIDVLNEAEKKLFSAEADIAEKLQYADVAVALSNALPEHFILRAQLLDAKGKALSTEYVTRKYTSAYEDFADKKPSDFDQDRVIDFADGGYAVMSEDVIVIKGEYVDHGDTIEFIDPVDLKPGDIIYVGGEFVQVGSMFTMPPNTTTFVWKMAVESFQQVLDIIDIDMTVDIGAAEEGYEAVYDGEMTIKPMRMKIENKKIEGVDNVLLNSDVCGTVRLKLIYDNSLSGMDEIECEMYVDIDGSASLTLGAGFADSVDITIVDFPLPGLPKTLHGDVEISVPIELSAKVGGTGTLNFDVKKGFTYTSESGYSAIDEIGDLKCEFKIGGDFEGRVGIGVSVGIEVLDDLLRPNIGGEFGVDVDGDAMLFTTDDGLSDDGTYKHACDQCIDINAGPYCTFPVGIEIAGIEDVGLDLVDIELDPECWRCHWSLKNDPESLYKGKEVFAAGQCRNRMYRTIVETMDIDDNIVTGKNVTVVRTDISGSGAQTGTKPGILSGSSTCKFYLYPGKYDASTTFNGFPASKAFTVEDSPEHVIIQEEPVYVECVVTDEDTEKPLGGVTVTVVCPDGTTRTGKTDETGVCVFNDLKAGVHEFAFTKAKYERKTFTSSAFVPGYRHQIQISMKGNDLPILEALVGWKGNDTFAPEKGSLPANAPRITLKSTGYVVTLNYEGCKAYEYRGQASRVTAFAMPTPGGDYAVVLNVFFSDMVDSATVIVLKPVNGVLKQMMYLSPGAWPEDVSVSGKFSSGMKFSGTIQPTGAKFSGTMKWTGPNRSGKKLSYEGCRIEWIEDENGEYLLVANCDMYVNTRPDHVGSAFTSYRIEDDGLVMVEQWFGSSAANVKNH